ncbi:MAG: NADH-quinone oxidoreductase subunit C [Dehalococcoidia bacterium]
MGIEQVVGSEIAETIEKWIPGTVVASDESSVTVNHKDVRRLMGVLKESEEFDFSYLTSITAVDYLQYFELIYNLVSMRSKRSLMVKARIYSRENPEVPSLTPLWKGADLQEREVFDLMGIRFSGHPNLKRIALWEGFEGHPLRKDFL